MLPPCGVCWYIVHWSTTDYEPCSFQAPAIQKMSRSQIFITDDCNAYLLLLKDSVFLIAVTVKQSNAQIMLSMIWPDRKVARFVSRISGWLYTMLMGLIRLFGALNFFYLGSKGDAVVRALTSHHCGPGSNPGVDVICGLSLLLVLSFAPRGFSPGTPVFPSPQKPTFPNSNSTRNQVDEEPLCGCATSKLLFIYLFILPWKVRTWRGLDPRRSFRLLILWESARFVATIPLKVATAEISFCSRVRQATHRDTYLNLRSEDVALLCVGNIFGGRPDSCPCYFTVPLAN